METNYTTSSSSRKSSESDEARYLQFRHLPDDKTRDGKPRLNRYSSTITKEHDFPGAKVRLYMPSSQQELRAFSLLSMMYRTLTDQAMLYAAGVPDTDAMKDSPHVGVATVWWEGNPCK